MQRPRKNSVCAEYLALKNKALVHLEEFQVSWNVLRQLPEDHLAAVAVLSYAVSETNALLRIYLSQAHEHVGQKALDSASNIQRFIIIRNLSSRLFEAENFITSLASKDDESQNVVSRLAKDSSIRFSELRSGEGYFVARDIRHEATAHYSFSAAKKNLRRVHKGADCNMYLHRLNGNCFYPFGEEVMFHARLNRRWEKIQTKEERDSFFSSWLDWTLEANAWLDRTHAEFTNELIFKALGRNQTRKATYSAPLEFSGHAADRLTPVFLQETDLLRTDD